MVYYIVSEAQNFNRSINHGMSKKHKMALNKLVILTHYLL